MKNSVTLMLAGLAALASAAPNLKPRQNDPEPTPTSTEVPGPSASCTRHEEIHLGSTCQYYINQHLEDGITKEDIIKWNPHFGNECSYLKWGEEICTMSSDFVKPDPLPPLAEEPLWWFNTQPGTTKKCNRFDHVEYGDTCGTYMTKYKITLKDLVAWNPDIGEDCRNMHWLTYLCTGVEGNNEAEPLPEIPEQTFDYSVVDDPDNLRWYYTQYGQPEDCKKWYTLNYDRGEGAWYNCDMISIGSKITRAQFQKWNPSVGQNCDGLWAHYSYCVGTESGN